MRSRVKLAWASGLRPDPIVEEAMPKKKPATKRAPVMVRDASAVHQCPQCGHAAPIRLDDLFPEREQPKGQPR